MLFRIWDFVAQKYGKFLTLEANSPGMLQAMQHLAEQSVFSGGSSLPLGWENAPSPSSSTFEALLAALTSPPQKSSPPGDGPFTQEWKSEVPGGGALPLGKKSGVPSFETMPQAWKSSIHADGSLPQGEKSVAPGDGTLPQVWKSAAWSDDGLEDDVATISYERALRARARYRTGSTDRSLTQVADPEPIGVSEAYPAHAAPVAAAAYRDIPPPESPVRAPETASHAPTLYERNLKTASITIRMSEAECAQLRKRADEAGLSISAYLRSCTFEAESLRTLVKETMAQLKSATAAGKHTADAPASSSWLHSARHWLACLFAPWLNSQRIARA